MQVETIYTFKNYLDIVTSGSLSQNKVEKICLISWGCFSWNNYSTRACWIWEDYSQLGATRPIGYLPSHIQRALVE